MTELSAKNDKDIENYIENYERLNKTEDPFYFSLLEERARRTQLKQTLDLEKSLNALKRAAVARTCITYGDLAKASDVDWRKARHQMNGKNGHWTDC